MEPAPIARGEVQNWKGADESEIASRPDSVRLGARHFGTELRPELELVPPAARSPWNPPGYMRSFAWPGSVGPAAASRDRLIITTTIPMIRPATAAAIITTPIEADRAEHDVAHRDLARDRRLANRLDDDRPGAGAGAAAVLAARRQVPARRRRLRPECPPPANMNTNTNTEPSTWKPERVYFRLTHASAPSASSASVRTPTPVAPLG